MISEAEVAVRARLGVLFAYEVGRLGKDDVHAVFPRSGGGRRGGRVGRGVVMV